MSEEDFDLLLVTTQREVPLSNAGRVSTDQAFSGTERQENGLDTPRADPSVCWQHPSVIVCLTHDSSKEARGHRSNSERKQAGRWCEGSVYGQPAVGRASDGGGGGALVLEGANGRSAGSVSEVEASGSSYGATM